jgi:hypothetical protein
MGWEEDGSQKTEDGRERLTIFVRLARTDRVDTLLDVVSVRLRVRAAVQLVYPIVKLESTAHSSREMERKSLS